MYYNLTESEVETLLQIAKEASKDSSVDSEILLGNVSNILNDDPRLSLKQLKWWISIARRVGHKDISFLSAAINEYLQTL